MRDMLYASPGFPSEALDAGQIAYLLDMHHNAVAAAFAAGKWPVMLAGYLWRPARSNLGKPQVNRKPRRRRRSVRPVRGPDGTPHPSIAAASRATGESKSTLDYWVRQELNGWAYVESVA